MFSSASRRAPGGLPWLIVAGVLVAALSLRGPILATSPVLRDIERDLGIDAAAAGLITAAPVLMFAIVTPAAALVIRRAGAELALFLSLAGVLVGSLIRVIPGFGALITGTIVIGVGITIGNVVIPVIIKRDVPPARVGLITAAYVATLNAGSLVTSLLTAPLASVIGWTWAIAAWSALTVGGILLWSVHLRGAARRGELWGDRYSGTGTVAAQDAHGIDPATVTGPLPVVARDRSLVRRPVAWLLLATFGMQTVMYYSLSTWLPSITADELSLTATDAGAISSVFQGVAIVGSFIVPALTRVGPFWLAPAVIAACWVTVTTGLFAAPQLTLLWLCIGAVAHGGGFVVIFAMLVAAARTDAEAAGMSALVQGGGYALGAIGAPLIGAVHDAAGNWQVPLGLLVIVAAAYTVALSFALGAARRGR